MKYLVAELMVRLEANTIVLGLANVPPSMVIGQFPATSTIACVINVVFNVGVADTDDDAVPSPIAFTAFNNIVYAVPFVKLVVPSVDNLVITTGLVVATGLRVVQFVPLLVEY